MFANDLNLSEIVEFNEGDINLQGRRLLLHDLQAFSELKKDLLEVLDFEQARKILIQFGYWWGKADAAAMKRVFKWRSIEELLKAGPRMQALAGLAKAVVKHLTVEPFHMELLWHESVEVSEQISSQGAAKDNTCWILCGHASGYASFCLNREIYFIEEQCVSKGDRICLAVGREKRFWGEQINGHLSDFKLKDIRNRVEQLSESLRRKSSQQNDQRKNSVIKNPAPSSVIQPEIRSTSYMRVLHLAERVAPYDSALLITGETGTGKEILARHIHSLSNRRDKTFLPINCGALPESLLESELFGHTAGAFTGANRERAGIFEEAAGGTVFLDEIGDISPALQVKLLRVLQEHEIVRIGENRARPIDVRIMAATNRDLHQMIMEDKFREDLYYRLAVVEIHTPPLRERVEDILPLARHFVKNYANSLKMPQLRLDASCLDYLQEYNWPGNIRELENAIERAALLCTGNVILPENLSLRSNYLKYNIPSSDEKSVLSLEQLVSRHIDSVLKLTQGNQRKACEILGISPTTLWRKLKELKR
ncbi:MAG: sigma-54-dependent Fis family transcriptional regulator [Fibrobacter sp.]|jgi:two-component system response regulator HydG|nr:sigma-54-dependent Fis family transcriptional regulator [Fibrobacter sp.]